MKAARHITKTITGKAASRLFRRWPLALGLALAVVISLFHEIPAFAGMDDASRTPLAVASISAPIQAPESAPCNGCNCLPGHGCHCLCHMTAQSIASTVVTPVVFKESLFPLPQSVPVRSCAGLPPFRPPRV
jgi:hypothetical protein